MSCLKINDALRIPSPIPSPSPNSNSNSYCFGSFQTKRVALLFNPGHARGSQPIDRPALPLSLSVSPSLSLSPCLPLCTLATFPTQLGKFQTHLLSDTRSSSALQFCFSSVKTNRGRHSRLHPTVRYPAGEATFEWIAEIVCSLSQFFSQCISVIDWFFGSWLNSSIYLVQKQLNIPALSMSAGYTDIHSSQPFSIW